MGGNARGSRPAGFKGGASAGFLNEIMLLQWTQVQNVKLLELIV